MKKYAYSLLSTGRRKDSIYIFSNCQGIMLAWLFFQSSLADKYDILLLEPNFVVQQWLETQQLMYLKQIRHMIEANSGYLNLLISTPIIQSSTLNAESLANTIHPSDILTFPYLVNTASFPLYETRKGWLGLDGITSADDISMVAKGDWFFNLKQRYLSSLQMLQDREAACDIKLSSFIDSNIHHMRLFYSHNHPSLLLGTVLFQEILKVLDLPLQMCPVKKADSDNHYIDTTSYITRLQTGLSPYVFKELGWQWSCHVDNWWDQDARHLLSQIILPRS